jgi:hypothetical protein
MDEADIKPRNGAGSHTKYHAPSHRTPAMTVATLPAAPSLSPRRGIGLLAIATGIAGFALLVVHPGGAATDFAGVLREEASNRATDAVVHGGFIVVLALQTVCYALLSARLGLTRGTVMAALVLFAFGVAFLSASMLVDGLMTPAIAARYAAKPDKIETARALFVLMGTAISFLMPVGLAFQSAAVTAWGWALTTGGSRVLGLSALAVGAVMLAAMAAGFANPLALMAGIVGTAIWAVLAGVALIRSNA